MKNKIEEYLIYQNKLTEELKEWVKDESIPIKERWELFLKSKLGNEENNYLAPSCINWTRVSLYDDFYIERYEVCPVDKFLNRALENKKHFEGKHNPYEDDLEEKLIRYFMIEKFVKSFKYDW